MGESTDRMSIFQLFGPSMGSFTAKSWMAFSAALMTDQRKSKSLLEYENDAALAESLGGGQ
jgi:hypothetical protein